MKKLKSNETEIEMIERNGVFVPIKQKPPQNEASKRVPSRTSVGANGRKGTSSRPLNLENIFGGIITDLFKVIRREMFK